MTNETREYINDCMEELGLNYQFMEWIGNISYPYFIGEYSEVAGDSEDGREETTFYLNGFTRGKWRELEDAKERIRKCFPSTGRTTILPSGMGIAISYDNANLIQTGDAELKRIQINLSIKEWRTS